MRVRTKRTSTSFQEIPESGCAGWGRSAEQSVKMKLKVEELVEGERGRRVDKRW
jgi:hypothetical protein